MIFHVLYYGRPFAVVTAPDFRAACVQVGVRFGGMAGLTIVKAL